MKYLEIVAPLEQSKEIVDMLQLRSVIELHSHEEQEGLTSLESGRTAAQLTKYRDCAQTALDILNRYAQDMRQREGHCGGKSGYRPLRRSARGS